MFYTIIILPRWFILFDRKQSVLHRLIAQRAHAGCEEGQSTQERLAVPAQRFLRLSVVAELLRQLRWFLGQLSEGIAKRALCLNHLEGIDERRLWGQGK